VTRRTVLVLIGLCCWSAEALAQTVDTSATGILTEQTSSVTQQVGTATQQLEPVTNQVASTAGSPTSTSTDSPQGDDSSRGTDSAEPCEIRPAKNGGSEEGGAAGGRAPGGGPGAFQAGARDGVLAARRERARGEGVLGSMTEGDKLPTALLPTAPNEFPFWGGVAARLVLGLAFVGFLAALTTHLLRRTRTG
jgi:hypothetical protein